MCMTAFDCETITFEVLLTYSARQLTVYAWYVGEIFPLDKVHDALAAHSKSGRDAKVFLK
jgi:hypothetical protein